MGIISINPFLYETENVRNIYLYNLIETILQQCGLNYFNCFQSRKVWGIYSLKVNVLLRKFYKIKEFEII